MSHDLIHMEVEGGVVTKPSLKHTTRGTAMCKFGMVAEPKWSRGDDPKVKRQMFFTVLAMGKTGETVYPLLKPGMPIRVEGEYKDGVYRDAITDEPKVGRLIFASRVKLFVFWTHRKISDKVKAAMDEIDKIRVPNLDELPF